MVEKLLTKKLVAKKQQGALKLNHDIEPRSQGVVICDIGDREAHDFEGGIY